MVLLRHLGQVLRLVLLVWVLLGRLCSHVLGVMVCHGVGRVSELSQASRRRGGLLHLRSLLVWRQVSRGVVIIMIHEYTTTTTDSQLFLYDVSIVHISLHGPDALTRAPG